jgi:alcohol dehydrogenase
MPKDIRIGGGALEQLPDLIRRLGGRRPLVVTDDYLVGSGLQQRVVELLEHDQLEAATFHGVVADPTSASLDQGLEIARSHRADLVIGVGGGSPIDTAKALAVLARKGGAMNDIKAPAEYSGPALPIVAIPTTAGTGSEATRFSIIIDSSTGEKMLCAGDAFLPTGAIVDFELTLSMPPRLTADTGLDALTHAIEAYVSRKHNPFSDALALQAITIIGKNLRPAYRDGSGRSARAEMMSAATIAGIAFSNASVALVHGMSRPLGAHFGVPHGMANAMLLATVTEYSRDSAATRYGQCGRALGVATPTDDDNTAARALTRELRALSEDLEVPTPAQFGISAVEWDAAVPTMAKQAIDSGSPSHNPRVPSVHDIEQLFAEVFQARS